MAVEGVEDSISVVDENGEEIVEVQPRKRPAPILKPAAPAGSMGGGGGEGGGRGGEAEFNPDVPPGYNHNNGPVTQPTMGGVIAPIRMGTHAHGRKDPPPPPCRTRTQWDEASVRKRKRKEYEMRGELKMDKYFSLESYRL